ncbi:MAG: Catalase-peroxidase [Actinomycetota bacterium]|jgi:catalase-peroxidase
MTEEAKCPVPHGVGTTPTTNSKWWPNQLSTAALIHHSEKSDPFGPDFDYVAEFKSLPLAQVKADIISAMKTSQPWWPADYGHYGPFFIRMAWHSAGTYRVSDGRGGAGQGLQRFAPLNSWPDNVNLDKARRLLWPIKQKYGRKLSWADLMILAGNVALEDMGFKTFGFAGGRADVWEPDNTYWGPETEWLANKRYDATRDAGTLENPLAAVQMGLIYVNPEGPDGNPDFQLSANDIRETFARMAMNDEETVALIAGGHAFGKAHGAGDAAQVGVAPEGGELHQVGLGWANSQGKGHSEDTISSGLEGAWTPTPIKWDNTYLELIFKYEWEKTHSPAGAVMWHPIDCERVDMTPDAHIPRQMNLPVMFTTDLALRYDAKYAEISRKFLADFDYFSDQFARAWFKLTHRDMGPRARYHGAEVPAEVLLWQDPVAEGSTEWTKKKEVIASAILATGLSNADLVKAAWRSASTFRNSDKRGGANGARIALEPQRSWAVNADVIPTIDKLAEVKSNLNVEISLADLIVFAGNLAIERAASEAGVKVQVEVSSGRGDSTQDQTDVESFNYLKPIADGFINWSEGNEETAEHLLLEKASLLGLTPPELTVLVGGLRAIGATSSNTQLSVLTSTPGVLNNEFFRNLLDNNIAWAPKSGQKGIYGSHAYADGERKWTATRADLVFASNSVLRALAEVYAADDANEKFVNDFVTAWTKVMKADLF